MNGIGSRVCLMVAAILIGVVPVFVTDARGDQQTPEFSCGPNALTYLSIPRDDDPTSGILGVQVRCVVVDMAAPVHSKPTVPRMVWYGEGWDFSPTDTNRHIGAAFAVPHKADLTGYAADIPGNGAQRDESFNGNIVVHLVEGNWPAPTVLDVTADCGCFHDRWTLVQSIQYTPLKRPATCGGTGSSSHFWQYSVSYVGHTGSGLRCMAHLGSWAIGWFGNGTMDGVAYTELGYRTPNGFAATDLCSGLFGARCMVFAGGSVKLKALKVETGASTTVTPKSRLKMMVTFAGTGATTWTERWTAK